MVHQAHLNLCHSPHPFEFAVLDAQAIPFPGEKFDAVIANHMLYHVPDRAQALSEIERVLRPGGCLVASTVGEAHLRELKALVSRFDPDEASESSAANPFTLENGGAQLSPWFSDVTIRRYEDALEVTEVASLIEYVLSESTRMTGDQHLQFAEHVEQEMAAQGGVIHITKDSGIFEAVRR
jgi:ubiquinone/menaquinone biosynthesis C-methylase UbiE